MTVVSVIMPTKAHVIKSHHNVGELPQQLP